MLFNFPLAWFSATFCEYFCVDERKRQHIVFFLLFSSLIWPVCLAGFECGYVVNSAAGWLCVAYDLQALIKYCAFPPTIAGFGWNFIGIQYMLVDWFVLTFVRWNLVRDTRSLNDLLSFAVALQKCIVFALDDRFYSTWSLSQICKKKKKSNQQMAVIILMYSIYVYICVWFDLHKNASGHTKDVAR